MRNLQLKPHVCHTPVCDRPNHLTPPLEERCRHSTTRPLNLQLLVLLCCSIISTFGLTGKTFQCNTLIKSPPSRGASMKSRYAPPHPPVSYCQRLPCLLMQEKPFIRGEICTERQGISHQITRQTASLLPGSEAVISEPVGGAGNQIKVWDGGWPSDFC